jgi:predicted exporter
VEVPGTASCDGNHNSQVEVPMSTTPAAPAPLRPVAQTAATPDEATRLTDYRKDVDALRRSYRRRARWNGVAANVLSLALVLTGAAVGLSSVTNPVFTAGLGVTVILLEGVARVMKPALRAACARRASRRLDREFRLYAVHARGYHAGGAHADTAFIAAVERILEQADAAEEREESGPEPTTRTKNTA